MKQKSREKKATKKSKRRKAYVKMRNMARPNLVRSEKAQKAQLFDLSREGGKKGERARRLLLTFRLEPEEREELKNLFKE